MKNTLLKYLSVLLTVCIFSFCAAACNEGSGGGIVNFDSEVNSGEEQAEVLEIISPNVETADIFTADYRRYVDCKDGTDVRYFCSEGGEIYAPVVIEWKSTYKNVVKFKAAYATSADFSDATETVVDKTENSIEVYNLYKDTEYFVSVKAVLTDGTTKEAKTSFRTTADGARPMKIGGIYNVRDLGGYKCSNGRTTLQGKIFRGGALSPSTIAAYYYVDLSPAGQKYMSETLGIKTDFDLRNLRENLELTESPIPNAKLEYYGIDGYMGAYTASEKYRAAFSALADESRYPVYIHCTGGADRTGTICAIIEALLGMSEEDILHDYETTSFSVYGIRGYNEKTYPFDKFWDKFKTYEGETLADKAENYMLSIGVTKGEIYNIRAIMYGEKTIQSN